MTFATCRGCGAAFKKEGYGAQCPAHPRLCVDCALREIAFHGYHNEVVAQPQNKCLEAYL